MKKGLSTYKSYNVHVSQYSTYMYSHIIIALQAPTPSGASVDVLAVRSPSPEQQWENGATGGWGESPKAELDFVADRDIEDLTKQLEKER